MGICRPVSADGSYYRTSSWKIRYEKRNRKGAPNAPTYHFVGYSSLYNFYCFPEKIRMRLRCVGGIVPDSPKLMTPATVNS
jgi:hypothetical protein